jgi:hypothetical protein
MRRWPRYFDKHFENRFIHRWRQPATKLRSTWEDLGQPARQASKAELHVVRVAALIGFASASPARLSPTKKMPAATIAVVCLRMAFPLSGTNRIVFMTDLLD